MSSINLEILLRQTDATDQIGEARIQAQVVPDGRDPKPSKVRFSLDVRFLEPFKCAIPLTEPRIQSCNVKRMITGYYLIFCRKIHPLLPITLRAAFLLSNFELRFYFRHLVWFLSIQDLTLLPLCQRLGEHALLVINLRQ